MSHFKGRLVQLTYKGENHPLIDNYKTEVFVYSIRTSLDIKQAVCSTLKRNFAETVAFALAQETDELLKVKAVEEKDNL